MDPVALYFDPIMLEHDPRGWDPQRPEWTRAVKALLAAQYADRPEAEMVFSHPERPQRLSAIVEHLQADASADLHWLAPPPATRAQLQRVHSRAHVEAMEALRGRHAWLSQDTTAISPRSVEAAQVAAGAGVTAVDAIHSGAFRRAFCLVRPPGHHALPDAAMGFCLYNNVAVAAAHARAAGCRRILIWDWDLHHGNGTQTIFYDDADVLFIDSHCQAPFYPGTGALEEIGGGAARWRNLNVPLPAGSGNAALLAVADHIVAPVAQAWKPEMILISAGFDAHHLDQTFRMDESGFAALTARVRKLADTLCGGRLIMLLEGGYSAAALAGSAAACIRILAGDEAPTASVAEDDPGLAASAAAAEFHAAARLPEGPD